MISGVDGDKEPQGIHHKKSSCNGNTSADVKLEDKIGNESIMMCCTAVGMAIF
jgi:hypothetical protein